MSSPKNILMTSHMADPKGSAMSFFTLITGLDRAAFLPIPLFAKPGPLIEKLKDQGIDSLLLSYKGIDKLLAVRRAKKIIRERNIDLVYVNCAVGFSRVIAIAAKSLNIPVIWHVREPPQGSRVLKNKKWMGKTASKVVAVSEELKKAIAPLAPTVKIDNGVDLSRFNQDVDGQKFRNELGFTDEHFVFGMVGSIESRKNSKMFIEVAIELAKQNKHLRFVITGGGESAYVEDVKNTIAQAGMNEYFTFTGSIWDIPALMASLDVLVMPSTWEGFPRVIVESMAVATPAIASDVGDVSYILDDDENGVVMKSITAAELTSQMQSAVNNPEKFKAMALAAAEKCHREFSQERHVERMQNVFFELIEKE